MCSVVVVLATLSACEVGAVGRRCRSGFGRDSTHVLVCRKGRWARLMTIRDYLALTAKPRPDPPDVRTAGGSLDIAAGGRFTMRLAGWARTRTDGAPVVRIVEMGGFWGGTPTVLTDATATLPRPDAPPGAAGFDVTLPALGGAHWLCLTVLDSLGNPDYNTSLGCPTINVDSGAPADPLPADAGWLQTLNYYRTSAGVVPVVEDPTRKDAITKHLIYLRDTPPEYFTGPYVNLHTENPASPYYTPEGAGYSHNVLTSSTVERRAIESWMTAPFHALNLLNPNYNTAAFDMLGGRAAALTLATPPAPPTIGAPVTFPGDGAVTPLRSFSGENPDPRDPCPDKGTWRGLPLIVVFPSDPPAGVSASMTLPNGVAVSPSDLCVVSRHNYVPVDPIYGPAGLSILSSNNAVLVIPRAPLTPGTHSVQLDVPGGSPVSWTFTVSR